ncbi:3-isopropylmalate dehydrogenase OS=Castellaniella defragrans OX=75697 GN=leuB PE=3 SV=1 [Castellaniella defragrans]
MKILVLPGDGIGLEITEPTMDVLRAVGARHGTRFDFQVEPIGFASLKANGTTLTDRVLALVPEADGTILGPVQHYDYPPRSEGGINASGELRTKFELFSNIRPCTSHPGLSILRKPMDMIIVRENTEGFYSDRNMYAGCGEFMSDADSAFSIRKITSRACSRVARTAFELAMRRRKKVTAVHKANVLKLSDNLFLREVRRVGQEFPEVELEELIVDAASALLIRRPESFDVMVTTNMYGDILSDEASELCGSLGLGGSLNRGDHVAVAQAQHGSAPDIAGKGVANPTSLILSAAMLLRWRGERDGDAALVRCADDIESVVDRALLDPATCTRDVGGMLGTKDYAKNLVDRLAALPV